MHSFISVLHVTPDQPAKHVQLNKPVRSLHIPFTQGLDAHSLMLVSQFTPVNPGLHVHKYMLIEGVVQTPLPVQF